MNSVFRDINNVKTEVCQISDKNTVFKSAIMGLNEIQISVVVDAVIDITEGDYIEYNGIKYTLNRDAEFDIENDVKYSYNLIFEHPQYRLIDKLIAHRVTGSTNFVLTGKLTDFVALIVWCVNQSGDNPRGVDTGWAVGSVIDTEYKNITFTDVNCREALKILADAFKLEFYFSGIGKTINFAERVENITAFVFENGKEKGLYKITQQNVDKEDTVTRVYVRGGNKNIPNEYADEEGCLKLPEDYLENLSEHNKVVERKVKFEEEFPHFLGVIAAVSGENNSVIICPEIDFDVQQLAVGSNARVNFLTGDLMGNSFEFAWDNSLKQVTLIEKDDEVALQNADGTRPAIPSASKKANIGDKFNFTGILMPQSYVDASITRLRAKGNKWLTFFSKKRVKFTLDIDHRWLRGKPELSAGDVVVISIPLKSFYQAIRITQIEKNIHTGVVQAIVSNYLEESWEDYLENKINSVKDEILSKQDDIKNTLEYIFKDGIITDAELTIITRELDYLAREHESIAKTYATIYGQSSGVHKTNLAAAKADYDLRYNSLATAINNVIADGAVTDAEKEQVNTLSAEYSTALANYREKELLASLAKSDIFVGGKSLLREYDIRFNFKYWGGTGEFEEIDLDAFEPAPYLEVSQDTIMWVYPEYEDNINVVSNTNWTVD